MTILQPISLKLGSQDNNGRHFDETRTTINPCNFGAVSRPEEKTKPRFIVQLHTFNEKRVGTLDSVSLNRQKWTFC